MKSEVCGCAVISNAISGLSDGSSGASPGLSTVQVNKKGHLTLINPLAAQVGFPIDSSFSRQGEFLYVLSSVEGTMDNDPAICVYSVDGECTLAKIECVTDGLPNFGVTENGVVGLALYM